MEFNFIIQHKVVGDAVPCGELEIWGGFARTRSVLAFPLFAAVAGYRIASSH